MHRVRATVTIREAYPELPVICEACKDAMLQRALGDAALNGRLGVVLIPHCQAPWISMDIDQRLVAPKCVGLGVTNNASHCMLSANYFLELHALVVRIASKLIETSGFSPSTALHPLQMRLMLAEGAKARIHLIPRTEARRTWRRGIFVLEYFGNFLSC